MKASDFLILLRAELQEKSEFHTDPELFAKLQRAYGSLQNDVPYFIHKEHLFIEQGISEYHLEFTPVKNATCHIDGVEIPFSGMERIFGHSESGAQAYGFMGDALYLKNAPLKECMGDVTYWHARKLETMQCNVELPHTYTEALRLLALSYIYEKPTLNSKQRDLSTHYLRLYMQALRGLVFDKKLRPKNITSKYQRI